MRVKARVRIRVKVKVMMRMWMQLTMRIKVTVNKVNSVYKGDANLSNMWFCTEIFGLNFAQGLYTRSIRGKDFTRGLNAR